MNFTNVALGRRLKVSSWRKTALGSWNNTADTQVYSIQSIDVEKAMKFIDEYEGDGKLTITHLAAIAASRMIDKYPQVNRIIRFGGLYQRQDVSVFFQVASDTTGEDLSGMTIKNAHNMSLTDVMAKMNKVSKSIKSGDDLQYKKVKNTLKYIPDFLIEYSSKHRNKSCSEILKLLAPDPFWI